MTPLPRALPVPSPIWKTTRPISICPPSVPSDTGPRGEVQSLTLLLVTVRGQLERIGLMLGPTPQSTEAQVLSLILGSGLHPPSRQRCPPPRKHVWDRQSCPRPAGYPERNPLPLGVTLTMLWAPVSPAQSCSPCPSLGESPHAQGTGVPAESGHRDTDTMLRTGW